MQTLTQPVIDPEIWGKIPDKQIGETIILSKGVQNRASDKETDVTQKDQLRILCFVKRTPRVEMVDATSHAILLANSAAFTLDLVLVVTGNIGDQVHWPADELLSNQMDCCRDWSLLGELVKLIEQIASAGAILLLGLWDEHHITLHVTSGLVMLAMGDFPGEVWYK